jgi:hypothetical protein
MLFLDTPYRTQFSHVLKEISVESELISKNAEENQLLIHFITNVHNCTLHLSTTLVSQVFS